MTESSRHATTAFRPTTATDQPFHYPLPRPFVEPDWRRIPGYREVTKAEWESALWQRKHTVKNLKELKDVLGKNTESCVLLVQRGDGTLYLAIEKDS